jgi:precorrin-2 methylase
MRRAEKGKVYLVGSGPGDPELLTVRAVRLLETADVVFHGDLVPDEVLGLVRRSALVTSVGKRFGRPKITQAGINELMIESARAGYSVLRLKSGDPLVFGRAGEEIAALRGAQISFEVVPGVTAVMAAGAALQLPLTDRSSASKLLFCTGRHVADKKIANRSAGVSLRRGVRDRVHRCHGASEQDDRGRCCRRRRKVHRSFGNLRQRPADLFVRDLARDGGAVYRGQRRGLGTPSPPFLYG